MNDLITGSVWDELKRFMKKNRAAADVAVAYFGKGGAQLRQLPAGSRLVVNASEAAVKQGQTCPEDLLELVLNGVRVFSASNLHAKVYAFQKRAYFGSANVSSHSEHRLDEALFVTTDPKAVRQAKQYVRDRCLYPLSEKLLERLQKAYRPPKWGDPKQKPRRRSRSSSVLPRVCLAPLVREAWTEDDKRHEAIGEKYAQTEQIHDSGWAIERFRWSGKHPFRKGDLVLQVMTEPDERQMVSPPGSLLYVHSYNRGRGRSSFVYLEVPQNRRRRSVDRLAEQLGLGDKKLLQTKGMVRNRKRAEELLKLWCDWEDA